MVDAGVTVVLSKLQEVASAEVTALLKVDDQIRVLRRGLSYLQAQVRGADQQRRGRASELLLLWTRETREVVFDVEDAVDEFHLKVEAFQVKARSGRTCTWWYHSAVNLLNGLAMQLFVRHGLSRDITKIEERIKEISQIKETYRIESSPSELWSQSTIGVVWDIEGGSTELRKQEFEALKDEILHTDGSCTHRPVISILGASGTGKTRLTRKLYNDRKIRESFEVVSWICLPPRVRFEQYVDMILEQIRPQVGGDTTGNTTTTDADEASSSSPPAQTATSSGEKLKELLKGRRYLVVLDGLVDTAGNWNSLLALLPGDKANRESRILITTQLSAKEMKHADTKTKPTVLDPLEPDQTDELFRERVHGVDGGGGGLLQQQQELEGLQKISMRVHGICRGLPLAVIVLGGILRTKAYPSEWKEVLSQKLETPMGEARAMRCLWLLAFEELPNHLKSCFLYLATASENVLLDAARMVRLWIAEGFVAPSKGKTLEEVGMGYLRELVSRGLVELVERDARGGISKVTVHGLLHAFVQAEAQESGFLEIHHHASVLSPHAVRRLAIHNFVDAYVDIPDQFPKLRSLLCDFLEEEQNNSDSRRRSAVQLHRQLHSRWPCPCGINPAEWLLRACGGSIDDTKKLHQLRIIRGSRFLRVIDLYGVMIARVPDEIGGSVHLRYLGIRNCRLRQLPASISKLDNLQTLDVRGTRVESVADEFWDLGALRHVLAGALLLPTKCPSAHLKHLQTLDGVVPAAAWSSSSTGCCPLNHMIYLRSLRVCSIPESPDVAAALLSALERMEFLVTLSLSGCLLPSGIFNNPSSRSLEALALHGRMDSPPSGPFFLPNLGKLTLSQSGPRNLTQDFIDKVAALPNLSEMELLDGSYGAQELVFRKGGFPSLTKLKLNNLVELEKMVLAHGSAPDLAILTSSGCAMMKLYDNRRTSSLEGENDEEDVSDIEVSPEPGLMLIRPRESPFGENDLGSTMMVREGVDKVMMQREAVDDMATLRMGEAMDAMHETVANMATEVSPEPGLMLIRPREFPFGANDLGSTMMVREVVMQREAVDDMATLRMGEDMDAMHETITNMAAEVSPEPGLMLIRPRESPFGENDLGSTMMVREGVDEVMMQREAVDDMATLRMEEAMDAMHETIANMAAENAFLKRKQEELLMIVRQNMPGEVMMLRGITDDKNEKEEGNKEHVEMQMPSLLVEDEEEEHIETQRPSLLDRIKYAIHDYSVAIQDMDG